MNAAEKELAGHCFYIIDFILFLAVFVVKLVNFRLNFIPTFRALVQKMIEARVDTNGALFKHVNLVLKFNDVTGPIVNVRLESLNL